MQEIIKKAKEIKCLITDVDGVLTNGYLYIDNHGNELKAFHVQDGMGLKLLMSAGIHVAVITTARNNVIEERMAQLGIELYYKGQVDIVDASQIVAQHVKAFLENQNLMASALTKDHRFYVSDFTRSFEASTRIFFQCEVQLEHYPLWE